MSCRRNLSGLLLGGTHICPRIRKLLACPLWSICGVHSFAYHCLLWDVWSGVCIRHWQVGFCGTYCNQRMVHEFMKQYCSLLYNVFTHQVQWGPSVHDRTQAQHLLASHMAIYQPPHHVVNLRLLFCHNGLQGTLLHRLGSRLCK